MGGVYTQDDVMAYTLVNALVSKEHGIKPEYVKQCVFNRSGHSGRKRRGRTQSRGRLPQDQRKLLIAN